MPSVEGAFKAACKRFQAVGLDSARIDARLLLGFVLGGGAERVLSQSERDLSSDESQEFARLVQRREAHEPMAYILGQREFWSLSFKVTPATLIPRPDTETLIEAALKTVLPPPANILDLGTGSGCLLLTLLHEWKEAHGTGVDVCKDALDVARQNAQALGMDTRSKFVWANWQDDHWDKELGHGQRDGFFDLVVSNPPYIPDADIECLETDVRDFEPRTALSGGLDGLAAYERIIQSLPKILRPGGWVLFEVGINQAQEILHRLERAGFANLGTRCDLSGIPRVVMGCLSSGQFTD